MTVSAGIFLIMFLTSLAGMIAIFVIHSRQMGELQRMLFAGNPDDYQRIKAGKAVDVKNKVENQPEQNLIEDNPIDIGDISGVQVDNEPVKEVKIYKT